jgi:hypothetical protein
MAEVTTRLGKCQLNLVTVGVNKLRLAWFGWQEKVSCKRVVVLESQGEGVPEIWEGCGREIGGGEGIFIEEQRLTWREEKPWYVKEG